MKPKQQKAFTLIELLVVIAIIGILSTLAVVSLQNARKSARDAKRVSDIKQIQTALELYYNDEGKYPDSIPEDLATYLPNFPQAPTPADGDCQEEDNNYNYQQENDGANYSLTFCLGSKTGELASGYKTANSGGIASAESAGSELIGSWKTLGQDLNGHVTNFSVVNGVPYILFTQWNEVESSYYSNVMKLNGSNWEMVGDFSSWLPIYYDIYIFYRYGIKLPFFVDNGISYTIHYDEEENIFSKVMKYDSSSAWTPVGNTLDGFIVSLFVDNGIPYIIYYNNEGVKLMKYDSSDAWIVVSEDLGSIIESCLFFIDNGTPYTVFNNSTLVKFNGSDWETVGSPLGGMGKIILDVFVDNGTPYVNLSQCEFDINGECVYYNTIMKFNGSSWEDISSVLGREVNIGTKFFVAHNTPYIVLSQYDYASDTNISVIMKYAGSSWIPVSDSLSVDSIPLFFVDNNIPYVSVVEYDLDIDDTTRIMKYSQ